MGDPSINTRGISAFPRLTEGLSAGFCCCAVLEKPCRRALLPQERQQIGGLERPPAQRRLAPRQTQRKRGRKSLSVPTFRPSSTRGGKKMPVRSFPRPAYPLPLLSCLSPCAFPALCSLLFCSLYCYVPICAAIPVFPVLLPAFPVRPFLSIPRRFCKSRVPVFPYPAMPLSGVDRLFCDRINRSSDALFLPCA